MKAILKKVLFEKEVFKKWKEQHFKHHYSQITTHYLHFFFSLGDKERKREELNSKPSCQELS